MKTCKIKGCSSKIHARGWCSRHYHRWYEYGDALRPYTRGAGYVRQDGYRILSINYRAIMEHRYIMEQHLNRKLKKSEIVHHINEDRLDNRIENLKIMTNGGHITHHHTKSPIVNGYRKCTKCYKMLPLSNFSRAGNSKIGYRANCKSCQVIYNRERLHKLKVSID